MGIKVDQKHTVILSFSLSLGLVLAGLTACGRAPSAKPQGQPASKSIGSTDDSSPAATPGPTQTPTREPVEIELPFDLVDAQGLQIPVTWTRSASGGGYQNQALIDFPLDVDRTGAFPRLTLSTALLELKSSRFKVQVSSVYYTDPLSGSPIEVKPMGEVLTWRIDLQKSLSLTPERLSSNPDQFLKLLVIDSSGQSISYALLLRFKPLLPTIRVERSAPSLLGLFQRGVLSSTGDGVETHSDRFYNDSDQDAALWIQQNDSILIHQLRDQQNYSIQGVDFQGKMVLAESHRYTDAQVRASVVGARSTSDRPEYASAENFGAWVSLSGQAWLRLPIARHSSIEVRWKTLLDPAALKCQVSPPRLMSFKQAYHWDSGAPFEASASATAYDTIVASWTDLVGGLTVVASDLAARADLVSRLLPPMGGQGVQTPVEDLKRASIQYQDVAQRVLEKDGDIQSAPLDGCHGVYF